MNNAACIVGRYTWIKIEGEFNALTVAQFLIEAGHSFYLEPWPEDEWRVGIKEGEDTIIAQVKEQLGIL